MKSIKEIFSIFKKKSCLTSQQQKCNETIQSWLKAMVMNNRNLKPYGSYKKVDIDRAIALAEYLISLSKKEQLEEIAKSFSYETLEPIYSEQVSIFLDDEIRLLYKFYPQYSDNIKKNEEPKKIQPKERKDHSLERFIDAQERMYEMALAEVKRGKKLSHWIWYIFPQLKGLGESYNSQYYGIDDIEEARAYLNHPVLGARLREITSVFLDSVGKNAQDVFGYLDAMKVRSCMTLFNEVSDDDLFRKVLDRYYSGLADEKTLAILGKLDVKFLCGAIAGDIIGSVYEWNRTKKMDFYLFTPFSKFTDDTVMTVANADWLITHDNLWVIMQDYGNRYPHAGYGGMFRTWLREDEPKPYNSFGNGSAMRVSPVGWAFDTLEETLEVAKQSAEITHNHPEGIKGAQATAACIFMARTGKSKQEIKEYVEKTFGYSLSRTCDEIRPDYHFDVTCQGSVPESIIAFLESTDFESAVRLAVSLGGDADTMGAITGGIAEAYYGGVSEHIRKEVLKRLPNEFIEVMQKFYQKFVEK